MIIRMVFTKYVTLALVNAVYNALSVPDTAHTSLISKFAKSLPDPAAALVAKYHQLINTIVSEPILFHSLGCSISAHSPTTQSSPSLRAR